MIEYIVKVYPNGYREWYRNGNRHREDGPAAEFVNGDKHWYLNGKLHRIDGPAIEDTDGNKEWLRNGCGMASTIVKMVLPSNMQMATSAGT